MTNASEKPRKKDSARLVWDTKPRRAPNPKDIEFQTAEVVLPNPKVAGELPLSFRDGLLSENELDKQKMNRLIWGDCLLAMQALLAKGYESKINLIYIDPPFDSKADYSHRMTIEGNEFTKEPSVIERLAYKDTWTGGTDSTSICSTATTTYETTTCRGRIHLGSLRPQRGTLCQSGLR